MSVRPASAVFTSGRDVWLYVTLDNSGRGCRPILVNEYYLAFPEDRPLTLLAFEIKDEAGQIAPRAHQSGGTRPRYTVGDLLTLRCGASYSWSIVVGRPEWEYSLTPGRYRLRARVENRVRSFFEREPHALKRLADATDLDQKHVLDLLRDFSVASDEVDIEIGGR